MTTAPVEDVGTMLRKEREGRISDAYLDQQRALHLMPQGYGGKGSRWADTVGWLTRALECFSVLDYGCGEGSLKAALNKHWPRLSVREYDPAIAGKDERPSFADLVVCTDVLEHVEPEKIGNVLAHIDGLARKAIFLVVCLRPSNKMLPDGRNAHLLVRSKAWWDAKVDEQGWERVESDAPIPVKVDQEKHWIAVLRPRR